MRRRLVSIPLVFSLAALIGTSAPGGAHVAAGTVERFAVETDLRLLESSPNGTMIAVASSGGSSLCTYAVPSGAEIACADLDAAEIDLREEDLSWVPDSRSVVVAERGLTSLTDGDLWRFEAATGALTNLTDDGVSGQLPLFSRGPSGGPFHVDVAPAWSPDGSTIAFSRSTYDDDPEATPSELWTLDVASGEQSRLAVFDREIPGLLYYGIVWAPDMSTIFVSVSHPDDEDERNGVWAVGTVSGEATQLTGAAEERDGHAPAVLTVSPTGEALALEYPHGSTDGGPATVQSPFALFTLANRELTPIDPPAEMANPNTAAVGPTFSPAGGSLLFGVSDPVASQGHLVARDLESGDETILATLPSEAMPFHYNPGEAIVVSPDGIAFVRTDFFEAYLIQLPDEHLVGSGSH